jgi:hypothetical protein
VFNFNLLDLEVVVAVRPTWCSAFLVTWATKAQVKSAALSKLSTSLVPHCFLYRGAGTLKNDH